MLGGASSLVIGGLERAFLAWGKVVTAHPAAVILTCTIITALASLGLLRFQQESRANLLWIPPDSQYNAHQAAVPALPSHKQFIFKHRTRIC